jgi:hypothetical protein
VIALGGIALSLSLITSTMLTPLSRVRAIGRLAEFIFQNPSAPALAAAFQDSGWDAPLTLRISQARLWLLPLWTVSNSEAGFERIFHGVTCVTLWPLALEPEQVWETEIGVSLPDGRGQGGFNPPGRAHSVGGETHA